MLDTTEILVFIGLGVVFAFGVIALAWWSRMNGARAAAYALIAVAFLYVGFAIRAENSEAWVGFEMSGVAVFASLAVISLMGKPWIAFLGLALQPVYAYYFHYIGAGQSFAPQTFVLTTMAFDATLALFVAYSIWRDKRVARDAPAPAPAHKLAARSQNRARKGA